MEITLKEYPMLAVAHQLLTVLDSKAIIAGGLPRDLLTGKQLT